MHKLSKLSTNQSVIVSLRSLLLSKTLSYLHMYTNNFYVYSTYVFQFVYVLSYQVSYIQYETVISVLRKCVHFIIFPFKFGKTQQILLISHLYISKTWHPYVSCIILSLYLLYLLHMIAINDVHMCCGPVCYMMYTFAVVLCVPWCTHVHLCCVTCVNILAMCKETV